MRILYIHHNGIPPSLDPARDRFQAMGVDCDILRPMWLSRREEIEELYGPGSYPVYTLGRARFHWLLGLPTAGLLGKLSAIWFYVAQGVRIHREQRFDCVVTYSHMMTGLCGAMIKLLTGAKLVVEVVTAPDRSYLARRPDPTLADRLMQRFSNFCLHVSLLSADITHLLGPALIASYPRLRNIRTAVFPEFVPVSLVPRRCDSQDPFILCVGAPWYLKGMDLLVTAFQQIAHEFPEVKLKLVGWFQDREVLDRLIAGNPRIEVFKPMPNPQVLEMMSRAMLFVLPSRCEGMGCVILEAMASGLPVLASDVGGIPALVRDGENGFLVPVGDVSRLRERLRQLLTDRGLRERMGEAGYRMAHSEFNEVAYQRHFTTMLQDAVNGGAWQR